MTNLDESDLALFFGCLPQKDEASECVGAWIFERPIDDVELTFSYSMLGDGLMLDLRKMGAERPFLTYILEDIEHMAIERRSGLQWLRARSRIGQMVELALEPELELRIARET